MDDKLIMAIFAALGFSLSSLFGVLKDRSKNNEDKITSTASIIMGINTKIALIEKDLEAMEKIKKDLNEAFGKLREMNRSLTDLKEIAEKCQKDLYDLFRSQTPP